MGGWSEMSDGKRRVWMERGATKGTRRNEDERRWGARRSGERAVGKRGTSCYVLAREQFSFI